MVEVVELEIPARPEFVGIARMAVSALAGVRPGLPYERVDDLRIVVSEACTSAIEAAAAMGITDARVTVRCLDGHDDLQVCIGAAGGAFDSTVSGDEPGADEQFRISLIRALVDEAEVCPSDSGSELRLVMHRDASEDGDGLPA